MVIHVASDSAYVQPTLLDHGARGLIKGGARHRRRIRGIRAGRPVLDPETRSSYAPRPPSHQTARLLRTGPVFAAIRRGKPSGAQRHSRSLDFLNKIDNSSTWCAHSRRGTWNKFLSALPETGSQIRAGRPFSSHPLSISPPPAYEAIPAAALPLGWRFSAGGRGQRLGQWARLGYCAAWSSPVMSIALPIEVVFWSGSARVSMLSPATLSACFRSIIEMF